MENFLNKLLDSEVVQKLSDISVKYLNIYIILKMISFLVVFILTIVFVAIFLYIYVKDFK